MEAVTALLVMSQDRRAGLLRDLQSLDIQVLTVVDCREARQLLETRPGVRVVITDASLPDGNWCDVFKTLIDSGVEATVVVAARSAGDRLRREVGWRGAFGTLAEPFQPREVRRVVEGAVREARRMSLAHLRAGAA